jgi:hypothetical protein
VPLSGVSSRRETGLSPFRRRLRGHRSDVEAELKAHRPHDRAARDRGRQHRAGSRYGESDYVSSGCGMGYEATIVPAERGVRLTGTDAWSWDAPFVHTAKKYGETPGRLADLGGHKAGRDIGYCHLEKLHNLEALPADGFYISCFPHKIRGASAAGPRRVAIFDDKLIGRLTRERHRSCCNQHPTTPAQELARIGLSKAPTSRSRTCRCGVSPHGAAKRFAAASRRRPDRRLRRSRRPHAEGLPEARPVPARSRR